MNDLKQMARKSIGILAFCTLLAAGAKAQCGRVPPQVAALAPGLAALPQPAVIWPHATQGESAERQLAQAEETADVPITGLWKTVYTSGGMVVNVGLDQWHSDGTQMANDAVPAIFGNICEGVWQKTGPRTYSLLHPVFNYDSSGVSVVSIFIERQQVTLDPGGNTFSATFTWDSYDFNGTPISGSHLAGTIKGTRITATGPFPFPFPL